MLGLKRGTVQLCEHEQAWEIEAQNTILRLKEILGAVIKDIQHVGSTSIPSIKDWRNYINFRDYLNSTPAVAKAYEDLKVLLAKQAPVDNGREKYLRGKHDFIVYTLRKALVYSYREKMVDVVINRPIGSVHPKYEDMIYPLNYGFIPNVFGGDGEELDVYLMGLNVPVKEYKAKVIAIVHRHNDVEDKLVAAPEGMSFTKMEIEDAVRFQEQYFESARKIRELRESINMGRKEFSNHTGIPIRTLEDWEAGRRTPPEYVPRLISYQLKYEELIQRINTSTDDKIEREGFNDRL